MISLSLGTVIAGNGSTLGGFSAEYQAILTAGSGFTRPSGAEQTLQNQLIVDLKAAGIWNKLDAFYMFANNITDSTGAFARINWKTPSANYGTAQNALPSITPKSGFTGNGSSAVNLNFAHFSGSNFSNPNGSIGVLYGTVQASTAAISTGAGGSRIRSGSSCSVTSSVITLTAAANSFIHVNRTAAAITAYSNGSSTGTSASLQPWATTDASNFFILWNGTSYGSSQIKLAFIGGDLASLASTFNTTIQSYITALNAL
jgi:hypothetical protein